MQDNPELRWGFIRKVYGIISFQLLLTIAFAYAVANYQPIPDFFTGSRFGYVMFIVIAISPLIVLCPLYIYRERHPVNYVLLSIYTLCFALALGVATAYYIDAKIILEAAISTVAVVISLTIYTFWASKRGQDFNFLVPFMIGAIVVIIVLVIIQEFTHLSRGWMIVYEGLFALIYCAFLVFDTQDLIKRFNYDEYIWASVQLYIDILGLFLHLLRFFQGGRNI